MPKGKARRVVILGMPGVGKSTVINKVAEAMNGKQVETKVVNFGTIMFEVAARQHKVNSRDDIRKLPIETQRELQVHAASEIARLTDSFVIVDTHLFIATSEGLWPGMPLNVLEALKPTNLVLVTANPSEILLRRAKDSTRARDNATLESLEHELLIAKILLFASGMVCGCPSLVVPNPDGGLDGAVEKIINALG